MTETAGIDVLYVDDEPDYADLAAEMLEREGDRLSVKIATSASVGLDQLKHSEYDCIVSVYAMPRQNGIEFLETIREEYTDLPFILYTRRGNEKVVSDAISAGATDYHQKGRGTNQYELLSNRIRNAVEQYRAQQAVAETESRLQTLAEHNNDIFWQFTADWNDLLFINSAYEEISGRTTDELRDNPQAFLDAVYPDDKPAVKDAMDQLSAGVSVDLEYRVNAEENYSRWVWVQGEPVFNDVDEVETVVGFARDITERKQREQELEHYQAFVEQSTDLITLLDASGRIEFNSPAVEDILGYGQSELVSDDPFEYIHPDDRERVRETIEQTLADPNTIKTTEFRFQHADGSWVWFESRGRNRLDDPNIEGIIVSQRDITDRVEQRQELQRERDKLDQFASILAHDLRNPLNVASGRLELARQDCDSDHLDNVAQAHERMETLIDDLLRLAQAGEPVDEIESVHVADTSDGCWRNVRMADASLVTETEQTFRADQSRLKQLLENMFRNAVEHVGDDVTVTVGDLDDRTGFYVADDGPGIPEDERDKVFESRYSTTDGGTGFGLHIVQEIAEAHGWNISVTDSEAGGARFEITGVEGVDE